MRMFILCALVVGVLAPQADAQSSLYVGLSNSKGYVVGAKLQQSGVFKYESDTTWTHFGWNHPFISGVARSPETGTWHLAGGNGELRSSDGGNHWKITTGWRVTEAQHVAVDHFDPALIYLATAYGIWRSVDDGITWYESSQGLKQNYTQTIVADHSVARRAIAATDGGLYVTTDSGVSWRMVGPMAAMVDLAQSAADASRWIAGTRSGDVFVSKDGGVTWEKSTEASSEVTGVACDPSNVDRMAYTTYGSGAQLTSDGGQSWQHIEAGLPTPYLLDVVFNPDVNGRIWIATKEEGIFFSDDSGSTWTYAGMTGTMVFDMVFLGQ